MPVASVIYLVACAAAGFGITYASGVKLTLEERVVFGSVLGAALVTAITFLPSLVLRDLTAIIVLAGLLVAAVAGGVALFAGRRRLVADWIDFRGHWTRSIPLAAVFAVCGAWTVHFLHQAYVYTPNGLYAGYVNIWGDWAAHLTYAGSFAYGHNFPPEFPVDPGHHLGYPFMVDFFAAALVPLGLSLTEALTATSGMLGLAFPAVLYLAGVRFLGERLGAGLGVFVFLLSGGLGFVLLGGDVLHGGLSVLSRLPREYTLERDHFNLQWLTPVLAYLVPQRSTLFGFSLVLILLVILWIALREHLGWRPFLFAGIAAGTLPAFHVHAWGTMVALPAFWALFNRRREWWLYFVPAVVIGLPVLVWMWPPDKTAICGDWPSYAGLCVQPGWLSFDDWRHLGVWVFPFDATAFWIWNTSLLLPLLIAAHFMYSSFPTGYPKWFAPMWLWFFVPNLLVLQPWVWDNTKFFVFWLLMGSILAGGALAVMFRAGIATSIVAIVVIFVMCFAGFLDLTRASDYSVSTNLFTDTGGLEVAEWVRHNTSPDAVFAVANQHNSPIPTLSGRRELVGYPGWLWTYGLADYQRKSDDDQKILQGDPAALDLVRLYGVDYVMIGPQEIAIGASPTFWNANGTKVYDRDGYAVYRVGHG